MRLTKSKLILAAVLAILSCVGLFISEKSLAAAPLQVVMQDQDTHAFKVIKSSPMSASLYHYFSMNWNGRDMYFDSLGTFFQYTQFTDRPLQNISRFAESRSEIASCISRTEIPDGAQKDVKGLLRQLCREPNIYYTSPVDYAISKRNGLLNVDVNLALRYQGDPNLHAASMQRVFDSVPCITAVYARSGLKLNLQLHEAKPADKDLVINVWDYFTRDNSLNWAALGVRRDGGAGDDHTDYGDVYESCGVLSHEVGHILGLPDRYDDPNCPDRAETTNNFASIMRKPSIQTGDSLIQDEDLHTIIAPLCGN